jgi:hypothetical protein
VVDQPRLKKKPTGLAWGRRRRSNAETCNDRTLAIVSIGYFGGGFVLLGI